MTSSYIINAISALLLLSFAIGALWPTKLLSHNPTASNLNDRFIPPGGVGVDQSRHALGTDSLGRDLVARLQYAGRFTLLLSLGSAVVTTLFAVAFGIAAGYFGGMFEAVVLRAVDALLSVPVILLAVALAAILGRGLFTLVVILVVTGWADFTRVVRADAIALKQRLFIESAEALGAKPGRIMVRHLLPNLISTISVMGTYVVARFILVESSISFLGMGIAPPATSWGAMVGDAQQYIFKAPWASIFPGLMITLTILSINFLGDALRDRLDPDL